MLSATKDTTTCLVATEGSYSVNLHNTRRKEAAKATSKSQQADGSLKQSITCGCSQKDILGDRDKDNGRDTCFLIYNS